MTKETEANKDSGSAFERGEIEQQLKKMRERADAMAENIKHMGKEELRALKAKTAHFLGEAREHGGEYMREAGHKAHETMDYVQENMSHKIRERPLASVAIAAGVGFVLALLASR